MRLLTLVAISAITLVYAACRSGKDLPAPVCPTNTNGPQMNAFSPNGDGRNDYYRILADSAHPITGMELHIFNASEEEVAVIFGATSSWDGRDSRTGNICPPGRYRVEFGITSFTNGSFQVAADGETFVYLLGTSGNGCLIAQGCSETSYVFEDQLDPVSHTKSFSTGEIFCR